MTDLLAIARSGVSAYGTALDALADNVANASTPGHVRRVTHLAGASVGGPLTPTDLGIRGGNGVAVAAIRRAENLLQTDSLRRAESQVQGLDTAARWLQDIETSISGSASLEQPISAFFTSLSDLATSPTSKANRAIVIKSAETLADRFNAAAEGVSRIEDNIRLNATTEVATLNGLSQALGQINTQLRRAGAAGNNSNNLADERDRLLAEMATILPIDVELDRNGLASVHAGDSSGPWLVRGENVNAARLADAADGAFILRVGPAGNDDPATLATGTLAGLSYAHVRAKATLDNLDSLANRIAGDINTTLQGGVDLDGNPGTPLFSTEKPVVEPMGANGGSARVTATMDDGATPPGDLTLVFDGSDWQLARSDASAAAAPGVLSLDGINLFVSGTPRNGDVFVVHMTGGAAGLGVRAIRDREIAAAPPFLVDAGTRDLGDVSIDVRLDPAASTAATITPPLRLEVEPDGSLNLLNDTGDILANGLAGDWLQGEGFAVRLNQNMDAFGFPIPLNPGDSFAVDAVAATGADSGANGNALALYGLETLATSAGTIGDAQDRLLTDISVPLKNMREQATVAATDRDTIATALQQSSGVDLDDEAAEMLRLQQAFQANARLITTAKEIFDTILNAAR